MHNDIHIELVTNIKYLHMITGDGGDHSNIYVGVCDMWFSCSERK